MQMENCEDKLVKYSALYAQSAESAGNMSSNAWDKGKMKKKLQKILNSLILLIKAYHPDDYKAVLRSWGILKERY